MLIKGSCHCGNISYLLDWTPDPVEIPARACTCSFCVKHGGVWTSCPTGALEIRCRDASRVTRYSFGTQTADFHVCTVCGGVPVVTSDIDGNTYAVVSVNAMDGIDPATLAHGSISFDGEEPGARLQRRLKGWIPRVRFIAGAKPLP
jgi:hypothetical protein